MTATSDIFFSSVASSDKSYKKTYYLPTKYLTSWIGAYAFCKANNMQLLTFDSPEEQTRFLKTLDNRYSFYQKLLETPEFELYLGAYAFQPGMANEFIWYFSGKKIYPDIDLEWNASTNEPNDTGGVEWCTSVKFGWYTRINDCQCNSMNNTRGTMVCQKLQFLGKKRGFNKMKEN